MLTVLQRREKARGTMRSATSTTPTDKANRADVSCMGCKKETREVNLPGALRLQCLNSRDAEFYMRWIHSEIYDEGAYE